MKKNIICLTLIILSATTFALTREEISVQEKENMQMLSQMGLPLPGSGIKVVSRATLGLTPAEIAHGDKEMAEFKDKGYVNKYISRPAELLKLTPIAIKKELESIVNKDSESYTGLSASLSQIKLAFAFPSISQNKALQGAFSDINILAAAPKGGFYKELGGWSGASQFFIYKEIGTCSYSVINIKASNAAARLAEEDVTYTINNKATILLPVTGSDSSGFLYFVKWYDTDNFHELECANIKYSPAINSATIELAKLIDKF